MHHCIIIVVLASGFYAALVQRDHDEDIIIDRSRTFRSFDRALTEAESWSLDLHIPLES